jgi:uncharacterized membrane protein
MGETLDRGADDAPAATAKRDREERAEAAGHSPEGELVTRSVTVNRPRARLYAFWRDLPNLAAFMENVEHIETVDARRSRWVVKAPAGKTVEWISAITEER